MSEPALRLAGMFREFGRIASDDVQESIHDHVTQEELPDATDIVSYLRSGHVLIDMMDVADDVFEPSRQILNGSSVRTDGDWLWREDFAYYVQRHRVQVPEQFLALIRRRGYVVPDRDVTTLRRCSSEAARLMF